MYMYTYASSIINIDSYDVSIYTGGKGNSLIKCRDV